MVGLFFVYKLVRFSVRGQAGEAFSNAQTVVDIERALRFFTEPELQRIVMDHPGVVRFLNQYYIGAHFPVTIAVLAWLYVRRPLGYLTTRRILLVSSAVGMLIHVVYPLAPPRMLPSLGFVDTGKLFGPAAYGTGAVFGDIANEFAAMPSLHFGWAVIMAVAIVRYGRTPLRWIIVVHPMLTTAAIVMTANHYWLDALVSGLVIALIYATASVGSRVLPTRRARARARQSSEADSAVVVDLTAAEDLGALSRASSSS